MHGSPSTRQRLLDTLKRGGGDVTIRELSRELRLSPMAVFRQLSVLEEEGLVFSESRRHGKGRPSKHFFLTSHGHERFRRAYGEFAVDLLETLRDSEGLATVGEILEQRERAHIESSRSRVCGATLEDRVQSVAVVLSEDGFMAEADPIDEQNCRLRLMNCAVERVARKFPRLCSCEAMLIQELADATVSRERHLLKQDPFCSYLVTRSSSV